MKLLIVVFLAETSLIVLRMSMTRRYANYLSYQSKLICHVRYKHLYYFILSIVTSDRYIAKRTSFPSYTSLIPLRPVLNTVNYHVFSFF